MNKLLPILLVVVLGACANRHHELTMIYENKLDNEIEICEQTNKLMKTFVVCVDNIEKEMIKDRWVDNIPLSTSTQDSYRVYNTRERIRKMKLKYSLVIADEVDNGRASRSAGNLEIAKIEKILWDIEDAKFAGQQQLSFEKSLKFLDIYSKAIERTTPKTPQTIIINE
jgi:hypothetical protein